MKKTVFKVILICFLSMLLLSCDLGINRREDSSSREVNIMATMGTLPTLYAGLTALSSENVSYLWYSRGETFSEFEEFPSKMIISAMIGENFSTDVGDEIIQIIQNELELNPDTIFNLYCDDLRVQFAITIMDAAGLNEDQYTVTLLSDGTGSYAEFDTRYAVADAASNWQTDLNRWESAKDGTNGVDNTTNVTLRNCKFPFAIEYSDSPIKARYFLQWPEALQSTDPTINDLIQESLENDNGLTKRTPQEILEELSDTDKQIFQTAVGLGGDTKTLYDSYFKNGTKPALIVSGTSTAGEGSNDSFEATIKDIVDDFGDEYKIFFKPHPRYDPVTITTGDLAGRKEFLEDLGIIILPGQMPMEALLFVYPQIKIGGYNSSLYMSVKAEQLAFFITDDTQTLSSPLPYLFDEGYFPGSVLTYPITR